MSATTKRKPIVAASANRLARNGSAIGSASAWLKAIVAPATLVTITAAQASAALSGLKRHAAIAASAANRAEIRKRDSGPGSITALRKIRLLTAVAWI